MLPSMPALDLLPHDAAIHHEFDAEDDDDTGSIAIVNSAQEKYWKKLVWEKSCDR